MTQYLLASDRTTKVHEDYYQEGWEYSDYTTEPLTIEGYRRVTELDPSNKNGKTGNLGQPYYQGDVQYIRSRTQATTGGSYVTIYQRREYIDNNGTYTIKVYMIPRDFVADATVPEAKDLFENFSNYTVYEDKVYGANNASGDNVVNDANAVYLSHLTGDNNTVAGTIVAPSESTVAQGESIRTRFPYTGDGVGTSGNITIRNRWQESSTVRYYYEPLPKGNVVVNYKDTEGSVIKEPVEDTPSSDVDTPYNTADDNKPNVIETEDGKKYVLVPEKTEGVEEGKVVEGTTEVTYVYQQVGGEVNARYVIEGTETELQDPTVVKPADSPIGEAYQGEKPAEIVRGGKTYVLSATSPVRSNEGDAPESGEVKEGPQIIVYQYVLKEEPKGNVVVTYVDTEGNVLKTPVDDVKDGSTGSDYNTVEDNRPETITTEDGKAYKLVSAGDYTVGTVDAEGHLTTSDAITGTVEEGTKTVTYVYEEVKGNVIVHYVDEEGNTIKPEVIDEDQSSTGTDYNTADRKETTITTADGKVYELVPAGTYPVGEVDSDNHLVSSDSTTGKVEEGTKDVTYVYRLKEEPKGNVIVNYKDTEGNIIKEPAEDTPSSDVGTPYNTADDNKPPVITTEEGKKYVLVPEKTEGVEEGKVVEGTTEVTYVYQQVGGEVNARYVIEGTETELQASTVVKPADSPIGEAYQGEKPTEIVKDGKTYVLSATSPVRANEGDAPESGEVTEGKQTIVYQYVLKKDPEPTPEVKKGNVVVHYVNEAGETIADDVVDTPESAVDTPYDTTDNKPKIIEKDGKKYIFTKVQDGDKETGTVVEGTTEVTYVYKELGKYIPYIPEKPGDAYDPNKPGTDEPPVPYDETPEEPTDNPPLPHIPGYTPKDPDGNPLKPVDPEDPTKGYIPPSIVDPNDPAKDTPVPYEKDPEPTPEEPGTPDTPDVPSPKSPESPMTPTASTRRNGSDKYMAKGVENLPNTGETSNYVGAVYGGMAIGLAVLLASKKRKRDSED